MAHLTNDQIITILLKWIIRLEQDNYPEVTPEKNAEERRKLFRVIKKEERNRNGT